MKTYNYLRLGFKVKKHCILEYNQSQLIKTIVRIFIQKKRKEKKEQDSDKDGKALYKLIKNAVYGKTIMKQDLRNRTDMRLVSNKKEYLKWT